MTHRLMTLGFGAIGLGVAVAGSALAQSYPVGPTGPFGHGTVPTPYQGFGFGGSGGHGATIPALPPAMALQTQRPFWLHQQGPFGQRPATGLPLQPNAITSRPSIPLALVAPPATPAANPTSPPRKRTFDGIEGSYVDTEITLEADDLSRLEAIVGADALAALAPAQGETFTLLLPDRFDAQAGGVLVPDDRPDDAVAVSEWQMIASQALAPARAAPPAALVTGFAGGLGGGQPMTIDAAADLRDRVCNENLDPEIVEMTVVSGGTSATLRWTDGRFCDR